MKQKFLKLGSLLMVLSAMLVAFSTTSCNKTEATKLEVTPATFADVAAEGQSGISLAVASNVKWTISVDKTWVEFGEKTGEKDKTVSFNVTKNEGEERTATITIKTDNGDVTLTRTVKQLEADVDLPGTPGDIQGPSEGEGSVELSIGPVTGATSYQWYKGTEKISGATSDKYTVRETGDYQVAGVNRAGEGPKSAVKSVTITAVPVPDDAPEIQGPSEGETSVALTVADIPNAATYAWYLDGTKISGATTTSYTATKSGKYQVAGVNSAGVEGKKSPEKQVTITGGSTEDAYYDVPEGAVFVEGTPFPGLWTTPGPTEWDTTVEYDSLNSGTLGYWINYWAVSNANQIGMYLSYEDGSIMYEEGTIFVDSRVPVAKNKDEWECVQMACYPSGATSVTLVKNPIVEYDKDSKTIYFGSEYDGNLLYIGCIGQDPAGGTGLSILTELYNDAVLQFTEGGSVSSKSAKKPDFIEYDAVSKTYKLKEGYTYNVVEFDASKVTYKK